MKKLTATMLCSGMLLMGAQGFADDAMKPAMSKEQMAKHDAMMKECMTKQKSMNASMSMDDMKTACTTELKMKHDAMGKDAMSKDKMGK